MDGQLATAAQEQVKREREAELQADNSAMDQLARMRATAKANEATSAGAAQNGATKPDPNADLKA